MAVSMGSMGVLLPRRCFLSPVNLSSRAPPFSAKIRAASSVMPTIETKADPIEDAKTIIIKPSLACPICYYPLINQPDAATSLSAPSGSRLKCSTCKKDYRGNETYLDLTVAGSSNDYVETMPPATELFRSGLVSFLYERGWRQNFVWGGFPGPEREFEMAKKYLEPTVGGTIVDASCGSGLFSRLFAKSGMYSLVVALDFSENMLRQCYEFIKQENIPIEKFLLVRADISRLPFVTSSIDAVHAGAALHCWPSPSAGVAEISRILRPGGVFVATTFILDNIFVPMPVLSSVRQLIAGATSNNLYLSEGELEGLCKSCGLVNFTCVRNRQFVMISAQKRS